MSGILDKLEENGISVKFIMFLPSFWISALVIIFVIGASILTNTWIGFLTYMSVMIAWMLGVFFGFKLLLIRIEIIDKEEGE